MSLANQTCWVVGGVGVVGRGITRGLLQAGATVIVNSRSPERLEKLSDNLGNPERLVTVNGSLLPGYASRTVTDTLDPTRRLNHVVAHGAVRWWAKPTAGEFQYYEFCAGCDETYSLNIRSNERLLDLTPEEFLQSSAQLASLHFSAAQQLIPRLRASGAPASYTFVTGDGSGKPGGERTAMGEINSHHVWGLSSALRQEMSQTSRNVTCREIRVGLPINESENEKGLSETGNPLSEDIGDLCAGLATAASKEGDEGRLIRLEEYEVLNSLLKEYNVALDEKVGSLPRYACEQGTA